MHQQPKLTPMEILSEHGGLLVRRVVEREDEVADALFEVATNGRKEWTQRDWSRLLRSLKATNLTVSEWLQMREKQLCSKSRHI